MDGTRRLGLAAEGTIEAHLVASLLTVLVCSSPVPSNPQTDTLRAVFRSLRLTRGLVHCAKLVQLDGPQAMLPPERVAAYSEFTRRVRELSRTDADFRHSQVHASPHFLFAAHNLAAGLSHVNTTFVLSLQHDYECRVTASNARACARAPSEALGVTRDDGACPGDAHSFADWRGPSTRRI